MSTASSLATTAEIPKLTDAQKDFETRLKTVLLLRETMTKAEETANAARSDKINALVKQLLPAAPAAPMAGTAVIELAKTFCKDLKTADEKALEGKAALESVRTSLEELNTKFEEEHCADAIRVYSKSLVEITRGENHRREIEKKIHELEKRCAPASVK